MHFSVTLLLTAMLNVCVFFSPPQVCFCIIPIKGTLFIAFPPPTPTQHSAICIHRGKKQLLPEHKRCLCFSRKVCEQRILQKSTSCSKDFSWESKTLWLCCSDILECIAGYIIVMGKGRRSCHQLPLWQKASHNVSDPLRLTVQ